MPANSRSCSHRFCSFTLGLAARLQHPQSLSCSPHLRLSECDMCTLSSFLAQLPFSVATRESISRLNKLLSSSISSGCSRAPSLRENASVMITRISLSERSDDAASCLFNSLRSGSFCSFVGLSVPASVFTKGASIGAFANANRSELASFISRMPLTISGPTPESAGLASIASAKMFCRSRSEIR